MKLTILAASLALSSVAMADSFTVQKVVDAHLDFEFLPGQDFIIDYTGNKLRIEDLAADFNGFGEVWHLPDGEVSVYVDYTLSYTLTDYETGERVESDDLNIAFNQFGVKSTATAYYLSGTGYGHYTETDGTIFSGSSLQPTWSNGYSADDVDPSEWIADGDLSDGGRLYTQASGYNSDKFHTFTLSSNYGGGQLQARAHGYVTLAPVPEPETYALFALGLGAVAVARGKKLRAAAEKKA